MDELLVSGRLFFVGGRMHLRDLQWERFSLRSHVILVTENSGEG